MQAILNIFDFWLMRWSITLGWTAVLVIILVQPEAQPIVNTGVQPAPPSFQRELAFVTLHIVSFCLTTLLWIWAVRQSPLWGALSVALLIGIVTEFLQALAPGRTPQLIDFLANGLGVLVAFLSWRFWHQRVVEPSSKMPVG